VRVYERVKRAKNSIHDYTGFQSVSNLLSVPVALLLALFGIFLPNQELQVLLGHPKKSERTALTSLTVLEPSAHF
jgi:hypothetical protein